MRWKCPNPDCYKLNNGGSECSNCGTNIQVKKDLEAMKKRREMERKKGYPEDEEVDGFREEEKENKRMRGYRGKKEGSSGKNRKRDQEKKPRNDKDEDNKKEYTETDKLFLNIRDQLDERHDKMERIVKLSRDITIESKRIIFHLHRIQGEDDKDLVLGDVEDRLDAVRTGLWQKVALELKGEEDYQFLRSYTNGLQEWIEALSLYHYICYNRLICWQDVQHNLVFKTSDGKKEDTTVSSDLKEQMKVMDLEDKKCDKDNQEKPTKADIASKSNDGDTVEIRVEVPQTEYVLGLADLTGELMRNAINSLSSGDRDVCFTVLQFLRSMYDGFLQVEQSAPRLVAKKLVVLKQSMRKVENACYAIEVRGSEIPKNRLADFVHNNMDSAAGDEYQDQVV